MDSCRQAPSLLKAVSSQGSCSAHPSLSTLPIIWKKWAHSTGHLRVRGGAFAQAWRLTGRWGWDRGAPTWPFPGPLPLAPIVTQCSQPSPSLASSMEPTTSLDTHTSQVWLRSSKGTLAPLLCSGGVVGVGWEVYGGRAQCDSQLAGCWPCAFLRSGSVMAAATALFTQVPLIGESPFVAGGGCSGPAVSGLQHPLGWATRLATAGEADRRREQRNPGLSSFWLKQLGFTSRQRGAGWVVVEEC